METTVGQDLISLIRNHRIASLGTVLDGHPLVSHVLYVATHDLSGFDIHVSRLAQHTKAMGQNPKVGLMIAETDTPTRNPQTLARLSIQGLAVPLDPGGRDYAEARESYIRKFPQTALNFDLGDFLLIRIQPIVARLVSGFGNIHDLTAQEITSLARQGNRYTE